MRAEQKTAIGNARRMRAEMLERRAEEERKVRRVQLQVFVHARFVLKFPAIRRFLRYLC